MCPKDYDLCAIRGDLDWSVAILMTVIEGWEATRRADGRAVESMASPGTVWNSFSGRKINHN